MIFVDLEKVYDQVPRDIIWWALRKKQVGEEYMYVCRRFGVDIPISNWDERITLWVRGL